MNIQKRRGVLVGRSSSPWRRSFGFLIGILLLVAAGRSGSGADVLLGVDVKAASRVEMSKVSHGDWNTLLKKYVDSAGMVDYQAWKASAADTQQLDKYLATLSTAAIDGGTQEVQVAFWINAYNAVTVRGILREYPTTSIRKHTAKLWGYNIWKNLKLRSGGRQFSLEDIEHKILRKLKEPRIHFAIVCASIGCPRLLNEAYDPERLDAQLTSNTTAFFADSSKFNFTETQFKLSPILDWFAEDFGESRSAQLKTIAPYLPPKAQAAVAKGSLKVSFLDYDWALNSQKTN